MSHDLIIAFVTSTVAGAFFLADHRLASPLRWRTSTPVDRDDQMGRVSGPPRARRAGLIAIAILAVIMTPGSLPVPPHFSGLAAIFIVQAMFPLLSTFWSVHPRLTAIRSLGYAIVMWSGLVTGGALSPRDVTTVVAGCGAVFILIGIGNEVRLRKHLRAHYRFAGTLHPNQQGTVDSLMLLAMAAIAAQHRWHPGIVAAAAMVPVSVLLATRSRTAVAATGLALLIAYPSTAIEPLMIAMLAILLIAATPWRRRIIDASPFRRRTRFGTIAGRLKVWEFAVRAIRTAWFLGFGYGSFWNDRRLEEIHETTGWQFRDAHSAYLDTLLNMGVIGCASFVLFLAALLAQATSANPAVPFLISLTLFAMIHSVAESTFVQPNFSSFVLAMTAGSFLRS